MSDLLLTWYGDDFTGSTDVMEALTLGGVPAVLFLEPPTAEFVQERNLCRNASQQRERLAWRVSVGQ